MGYSTKKRCPDHDKRLWRSVTGWGKFHCLDCEYYRMLIKEGLLELITDPDEIREIEAERSSAQSIIYLN